MWIRLEQGSEVPGDSAPSHPVISPGLSCGQWMEVMGGCSSRLLVIFAVSRGLLIWNTCPFFINDTCIDL